MRLKEFSVLNYGQTPLSFDSPLKPGRFNLFYGPNESGKSLMIDAILKCLLQDDARYSPRGTSDYVFKHIDRVDVEPEGFAYVEIGDEVYKLPDEGSLSEVTDTQPDIRKVSPSDFRNIFVVRDSNLAPSETVGTDYYGNVTEKLTGLRTRTIENIIESIEEVGKVTDTGRLLNTADTEKLKDRFEQAKQIIETIEDLQTRAEDKDFYELEEMLFQTRIEMNELEERMESLNEARKAELYRKGSEELDKIQSAQDALAQFENIDEDRLHEWENCIDRMEQRENTLNERESEINRLEEQIEDLEKPIHEVENEVSHLEDQQDTIESEVKPLFRDADDLDETLAGLAPHETTYKRGWGILGITTALCLGTSLYVNHVYGYGVTVVLGILTGYVFYLYNRIQRKRSNYRTILKRINKHLAPMKLDAEDLTTIKQNVGEFEMELESKRDELERLTEKKQNHKTRIKTLREQVEDEIKPDLESGKQRIDKIREESDVETLEEYKQAVEKKKSYEETLRDSRKTLEAHFGQETASIDEQLDSWTQQIDELAEFDRNGKTREYDEERLKETKNRLDELERQEVEYENDLEEINNEIRSIRESIPDILGPAGGDLPSCHDLSDLSTVKQRLIDFRNEVENRRVNAIEARKIFEEIETQERSKIGDLFGPGSRISEHFSTITDGRFETVQYDAEDNSIHVISPNEQEFEPYKLSGGTYDQLYFAIRLALGDKLLDGAPGFFILDDPFIKSDTNRLNRQMSLLEEVVGSGWQILYFSAKEEVLDAVKKLSLEEVNIFRKNDDF